jgi:hypothetical protein
MRVNWMNVDEKRQGGSQRLQSRAAMAISTVVPTGPL